MNAAVLGERFRHVEACMGTMFSFDVRGAVTAPTLASVLATLHDADAVFSTYRPDSAISRLGRGEVAVADCPPEVAVVLDLCVQGTRQTGGWFSALASGQLDPSGVVKGWAVERVSAQLRAAGHGAHIVNGGGDIQSAGGPWRFGVADPTDPQRLLAVLTGTDLAVATSGSAERGQHILDPFTRRPATELASVTVVGPSLTQADIYATAGFAMGARAAEWLAGLDGYEGFVVDVNGRSWRSAGLPVDGS